MTNFSKGASVATRLAELERSAPKHWAARGASARPNLHGLLRYPAMMVPSMQGDIIDAVKDGLGIDCHVADPFVGSGTVMTEALTRGLNFVGVDINPLAVLACQAKAAIDAGVDLEGAAIIVLRALRSDHTETIDVDFSQREKWFEPANAVQLSRIRRAILAVQDDSARKVLWTVFAETIRVTSNSRTSTYKLHIRPTGDRISTDRIVPCFENNLKGALDRVIAYRVAISARSTPKPHATVICNDARSANLKVFDNHQILVTSPPYGDNQTTIPYGQFSFLALNWIPRDDVPSGPHSDLMANTHRLDSVSLGGSRKNALAKEDRIAEVSETYVDIRDRAVQAGQAHSFAKVTSFLHDFHEALENLRPSAGNAHWVVTTGNRTVGGQRVPLDAICKEFIIGLGGRPIATLQRNLPTKRMPSRNSIGEMITKETTLVAAF